MPRLTWRSAVLSWRRTINPAACFEASSWCPFPLRRHLDVAFAFYVAKLYTGSDFDQCRLLDLAVSGPGIGPGWQGMLNRYGYAQIVRRAASLAALAREMEALGDGPGSVERVILAIWEPVQPDVLQAVLLATAGLRCILLICKGAQHGAMLAAAGFSLVKQRSATARRPTVALYHRGNAFSLSARPTGTAVS